MIEIPGQARDGNVDVFNSTYKIVADDRDAGSLRHAQDRQVRDGNG